MALKKKTAEEKAKAKALKNKVISFEDYPFLVAVKPREKYVFHSDYFTVDGAYATIMNFFHMEGATDGYPAFWGIGRIPQGLDPDIVTVSFEQVRRMTKSWVDAHEHTAESIAQKNEDEQERSGTSTTKYKSSRKVKDFEEIAEELGDNAAYLQCTFRLMVKAPTLEKLDEAVEKLGRRYTDVFSTLDAAPYIGRQRQELTTLFSTNNKKIGRPFYFTSTEFAGNYNLVTHGMEDPYGEYVGRMYGDVNNSAVIFETNSYKHHVVIANEFYNEKLGRTPMADYWGSKLSQSCMIHNGRAVHIILDGCNLDLLGPKFEKLTYRIDMNQGDLNMFEMFGKTKDELTIFPTQMQKLILMAEQAYETTESDRSIIRGSLEEIATQFYIDNRMWYDNATENQHRLRVVDIPHNQVPKLEMFVSYLDTAHKKALAAATRDEEKIHALGILRATFRTMLTANGDLFNTTTTSTIDGAKKGRRVIYDFSKLRARGNGVAMAQLVNVIGFAINNIGKNDTIIFHGTERIADRVKPYISDQLDMLHVRGGRAVFLFNNIEKMLDDRSFSAFDKADYTVFGTMSPNQITEYQEKLGRTIPNDLVNLVSRKNERLAFLRRGFTNVVFEQDLLLGMKKKREGARI
jgi:hypothetical protein